MTRHTWRATALAVAFGLGVNVHAQEPSTQPEPILETGELMLMVIKPAYDELKSKMAKPLPDRKSLAQLYQSAARLAEFENLILFRPHARAATADWKAFATNARKSTATLASEILKTLGRPEPADLQSVRKAFEGVSVACNACHRANSREAPVIKP